MINWVNKWGINIFCRPGPLPPGGMEEASSAASSDGRDEGWFLTSYSLSSALDFWKVKLFYIYIFFLGNLSFENYVLSITQHLYLATLKSETIIVPQWILLMNSCDTLFGNFTSEILSLLVRGFLHNKSNTLYSRLSKCA